MDLLTFLMQSPELRDRACAARFASGWSPGYVKKGGHIVQQGEPDRNEIIILDGCAASCIYDQRGVAVCVGLHTGPGIITPNIARSRDGLSLVSVEAATDALVVQMNSDVLTERMIVSQPIRDWANRALREELGRKADREWCLAALGGSDRLIWFRERFAGYEDIFVHSLIASFLGITPVTLSRLRTRGL